MLKGWDKLSSLGNFDFSKIQKLQEQIEKLSSPQKLHQFNETSVKELAARILAKVIKRTPVGIYSEEINFTTKEGDEVSFKVSSNKGKVGGTLRRGWTANTETEAESNSQNNAKVKEYLNSIEVKKSGNIYQITIFNPVSYASYVEYGHTTMNRKGWVNGKFMLTISEQELNAQKDAIIQKRMTEYLRTCFNA